MPDGCFAAEAMLQQLSKPDNTFEATGAPCQCHSPADGQARIAESVEDPDMVGLERIVKGKKRNPISEQQSDSQQHATFPEQSNLARSTQLSGHDKYGEDMLAER